MTDRPLALVVDTYSLFFRAHHALPAMNTRSGEPTSALYGFCAALLRELGQRKPVELAFAVDAPQRTFRHERMPTYKDDSFIPMQVRGQRRAFHDPKAE